MSEFEKFMDSDINHGQIEEINSMEYIFNDFHALKIFYPFDMKTLGITVRLLIVKL